MASNLGIESPFGAYDSIFSGSPLGPQANARAMYSPEQLSYLDSLSAYTADQAKQGWDVSPLRQFVTSAPTNDRRSDVAGIAETDNFQRRRGQNRYLTPDELDAQIAAAKGRGIGERFGTNIYGGDSARTRVSYADQPFRLYDGGKLIFEGQGREDARTATQMAQSISDAGGNKANWKMETKLGPDSNWVKVGEDTPASTGLMSAFVNYGVPALVALTNPAAFAAMAGAAGLSGAAAGIGGAAAAGATGGALGKALQGQSIGNIAKGGVIGGVTAGTLKGLGGSDFFGGNTGGTENIGFSDAFNAARGAGGSLLPAQAGEIVVTGLRQATPSLLLGVGGSLAGSAANALSEPMQTVTARAPTMQPALPIAGIGALGAVAVPNLGGAEMSYAPEDPEAVVEASRVPSVSGMAALPIAAATYPALAGIGGAAPTVEKPKTLEDYVRMGLGGISTIQGLAGLLQGGQNAGGAGIGGFNPNPGTVAYEPLNRTQNAPTFDPFTYGQSGGEFKFFSDAAPKFQINT